MSEKMVKFNYVVDEVVLCFEPDSTKARVLYDAKVLETAYLRDRNGHKQPAYKIHFHGWNSSWDRTVGEVYILKSTEENRSLMRKLAETAKNYRQNKTRKKKIDDLLAKAFHGQTPIFESGSDSEEEHRGDRPDQDLSNSHEFDREPIIEIVIPDVLKNRLKDDFCAINQKRKLLKLPAEPNVISVLEGFVRSFSMNVLCGISEKLSSGSGSERSIPLCKEVADGIRICFDFTLPLVLLYSTERDQYSKVMTNCKRIQLKKNSSEVPDSPSGYLSASRHAVSKPLLDEPAPKLTKVSFKSPEVQSKRITRQASAESSYQAQDLTKPNRCISQNAHNLSKLHASELKRKELGRRCQGVNANNSTSKSEQGEGLRVESILSSCITLPPPPLLVSNSGQCSLRQAAGLASSQHCSSPVGIEDELCNKPGDEDITGVLSWKLLPQEICKQSPPLPSVVYGPQHLLRLFVKLPEIISRMQMPAPKVTVLLTYLENLLEYMASRQEDLFKDSAYIDDTA